MGRSRAAAYGVLIVAGSLTSFVAESFVCRWLAPRSVSLGPVFLTAFAYVFAAVLSGIAGTCVFWFLSRTDPSPSLSLFVLTSAVGWVWVPSVLLLSRQDSIGAVLAGTMGAAVMATGLRKCYIGYRNSRHNSPGWKPEELFAQSLYRLPGSDMPPHFGMHLWRVLRTARTSDLCRQHPAGFLHIPVSVETHSCE